MAKAEKPEVNKKQAVKEYLKAHRKAGPKETCLALKLQGIDVSPAYVSGIKFQMKPKKRKKAAAAAPAPVPGDQVSLSALLEAKKLIQKLGSIAQAKQAIAALAQLGQ